MAAGAHWDCSYCTWTGFSAQILLRKHQNKEVSYPSGTLNHSWVYHRNPDRVNVAREGKLKVSPTPGSKITIIIASFPGTGGWRGEEEIHSMKLLVEEH